MGLETVRMPLWPGATGVSQKALEKVEEEGPDHLAIGINLGSPQSTDI